LEPSFQGSIRILRSRELQADKKLSAGQLRYSWAEAYGSLAVLDKSSPKAPVGVLSDLWDVESDIVECVCKCFVNLGLGELGTGDCSAREFRLHDLQWLYCERWCRMPPPDHGVPVSLWHERLLDSLIIRTSAVNFVGAALGTSIVPRESPTSEKYIEAFCGALGLGEAYWLLHFVRHVCGMKGGVMIAKDIVTDYRWVREVTERGWPADVARHIDHVIQSSEALRLECAQFELEKGERSSIKSKDDLPHTCAMSECDEEGLKDVAIVFRLEIPPAVARPARNEFDSGECPLHPGARSVGNSGLAHCVVGRFGISRSESGAAEMDTDVSMHVGGQGVIDALVHTVRKHAHGPWLCPKNRCSTGTDRRGLERIIRQEDALRTRMETRILSR
jgi:hypothetical protein